jgi:hypothetical protein
MSIEAMKQALEALETLNSGDSYKTHNAATALRRALAEAEDAVAAEREACAKVCDARSDEDGFEGGYADQCAIEIRARGEK